MGTCPTIFREFIVKIVYILIKTGILPQSMRYPAGRPQNTEQNSSTIHCRMTNISAHITIKHHNLYKRKLFLIEPPDCQKREGDKI